MNNELFRQIETNMTKGMIYAYISQLQKLTIKVCKNLCEIILFIYVKLFLDKMIKSAKFQLVKRDCFLVTL